MKRHITLLLSVILVVFALVGCSGHQHTYSDAWQMNETNHWHASNCTDGEDCAAAKAAEAKHEDADNNKACDVCGYDYGHTHTYEEALTGDETGHAYAPTCGCTIEGDKKSTHVDSNIDGACDDCGYNAGHEHTVTDNIGMDAEQHWKTVSCGHNVKAEAEAHDFDEVGLCTVCGYTEDELDVNKAIEIGAFYDTEVVGGKIIYMRDNTGSSISVTTTEYVFGQGAAKYSVTEDFISESYSSSDSWVNHLVLAGDSSIFAVRETVFENEKLIEKPYDSFTKNDLYGYYFRDVDYDPDSPLNFYGVKGLIQGLYTLAGDDADESIIVKNGEIYYTFNTNTVVSGTYFAISVEFTIGEENIFENVFVTYAKYETTSEGAPEGILPLSIYTYEITQTTDGDDYIPAYLPENMLATEIELSKGEMDYESGKVNYTESYKNGATITVNAGSYVSFYVKPIAPTTANIAFDSITVTTNDDNVSFDTIDATGEVYAFGISRVGTYELTVSTLNATVKYVLVVEPAELTELTVTVDDKEYYSWDKAPSFVLDNGTLSMTIGAIPNNGAVTDYTVSLAPGTVGATLNGDTLTITAAGVYTVVVKDKATDIEATLDITVIEPVVFDPADVFSGTYEVKFYGSTIKTIVFTPSADATTGTVTVTDHELGTYSGSYTYTYAEGVVTYTPELPFVFNGGTATFLWENDDFYDVTHTPASEGGEGGSGDILAPVDGYYAAVSDMGSEEFYFTVEGETVTIHDGDFAGVFTWNATEQKFLNSESVPIYFSDPYEDGSLAINLTMGRWFWAEPSVPSTPGGGDGGSVGSVVPVNGYYAAMTFGGEAFHFTVEGETVTIHDGDFAGVFTWNETEQKFLNSANVPIYFSDPADDGNLVINLTMGRWFSIEPAIPTTPGGGEGGGNTGGDSEIAEFIDGHAFQYAGYTWILDFDYCWFDNTFGTYIEFTYEIEGNEIILTPLAGKDLGIFTGATLTYDESSNSINVELADSTNMIFDFEF